MLSPGAFASPATYPDSDACSPGSAVEGVDRHVDFDVHGVVGVRLVDPAPADAAAVGAQLQGLRAPLTRNPDIVVRFVGRIPTPGLRYVEVHRSGFTDDGFFILWHKRRPIRARIPFERIGKHCEIVCERGAGPVPLLKQVLKLTALQKGYVCLHASAFEYAGTGVIVTGWTHGGKTSTLLAFAGNGGHYVGDDLILLSPGGSKMFGIPAPIALSDWQIDQLPWVRHRLRRRERWRMEGVRQLERLRQRFEGGGSDARYPAQLLTAAVPALKRRFGKVQLRPDTLFGGKLRSISEPGKVFLMMSHDSPDIEVEPVDPGEVAARMQSSVRHEGLSLFAQYLEYKFAFPDRANEFIERAHQLESELLERALDGKEAYVVRHPFPIPLQALYRAMKPFCDHNQVTEFASANPR